MYPRIANILKSNSFFLFGARGTGKSSLLKKLFSEEESLYLDLLDIETYRQVQIKPSSLAEIIKQEGKRWCIIDEVQKIPELLDIVHQEIEKKEVKFALTGSSARKLKRNSANMLGGRAFFYKLFPLTHIELLKDFNLNEVLNFGSIAKIFDFTTQEEKSMFLKSYVETYLKEEILIEQIIRSLPPFRKFLQLAAIYDTEIVNFSNIARDIGSDPKNISNYYSILEDTLLGFHLEPYHRSIRKRQKKSPKFYWFDTGVSRALAGTIDNYAVEKTPEYGILFESFIVNEVHRLLSYSNKLFTLSFLRIEDNLEIDLIIERAGLPTYLIEIKSTDYINENHISSLRHLAKDFDNAIPIVLSNDKINKNIDGISCFYWMDGLREMKVTTNNLSFG